MKLFFCFISGSLEKWSTMFFFFRLPLEPPPPPRASPPEVETEMPAIFHRVLQPDHEEAFTELSATRRAAAAAAAATWTIDSTCVFAASCSRLEAKKNKNNTFRLLQDSVEWRSGVDWSPWPSCKKNHNALRR